MNTVKNLLLSTLTMCIGLLAASGVRAAEPFPLKLRIGTYNVGHFNEGNIGGYGAGQKSEPAMLQWRKWIGQQSFDVFFVNEWNDFFDKDKTIHAADALLHPYFNTVCFGQRHAWIYNGIAANYALTNIRQLELTHKEYYATVADLNIGGKTITLMSVHIPWQECCHDSSIDALIAEMKKYEYLICGGDMNANDRSQRKFLEAGFNMANGGNEGWKCTLARKCAEGLADSSSHIDNIVTTQNIKIMNVSAPMTGLNDTDHLPVLADVVITDAAPSRTYINELADSIASADVSRLRVMTFNIHIGIGMDDRLDLERVAKTINEQMPDLVALQEVDRIADRTQRIDEVAELSRLTGMQAIYGRTLYRSNGEYGIAILSKHPVLEHTYTQLPRLGQREDRGLLTVKVKLKNRIVRFACTHFCHESEERRIMQAQAVNSLLLNDNTPVIIGGDFNAEPSDRSILTLKRQWTDATDAKPTFNSTAPRIKIDYLLFYPKTAFRVKETKVIDDRVSSDHRPVISILEIVN
ncbi:MAG: endonuclease/exonuclease/phosphatase family protein [Tannerella sp.]|nr:endonuclease/exonuclease/phosphatase family protein [Tannerella sp.]